MKNIGPEAYFRNFTVIFNNKTVPLFFGSQISDAQTRIHLLLLKRKQIKLHDIGPGSTLKPHTSHVSWFEQANTLKRMFLFFFTLLIVVFNTMVAGRKVVFLSDRLKHFYEEH